MGGKILDYEAKQIRNEGEDKVYKTLRLFLDDIGDKAVNILMAIDTVEELDELLKRYETEE